MKVVIDIPEEDYKLACKYPEVLFGSYGRAIAKGTPLPKGHGKLIDANRFLKDNEDYTGFILYSRKCNGENIYKDTLEDLIAEAQIIIEAD